MYVDLSRPLPIYLRFIIITDNESTGDITYAQLEEEDLLTEEEKLRVIGQNHS